MGAWPGNLTSVMGPVECRQGGDGAGRPELQGRESVWDRQEAGGEGKLGGRTGGGRQGEAPGAKNGERQVTGDWGWAVTGCGRERKEGTRTTPGGLPW